MVEVFAECFVRGQGEALDERESQVLELRYGFGGGEVHTLEEVGRVLRVSKERVRQLQERALRKIVGQGSRQIRKGNYDSPCAQLQIMVEEWVRPGEEGEFERVLEFCRAELGFLPQERLALPLVVRFLRYRGEKAESYLEQLRELERARVREIRREARTGAEFGEMLGAVIWPKQVQRVELEKVGIGRKREVNPEGKGAAGEFWSEKLEREVQFESGLEREFYEKLEGWPEVVHYQEQPFRVGYELEGERRSYYPDVFFVLRDGRGVVVEVVPRFQMGLRENLVKWSALRKYCGERGWGVLVTDGRQSIQQMQRYPVREEFERGLLEALAGKGSEGLDWQEYRAVRDRYEAKGAELVAVILKNRLRWELQPFRLRMGEK